MILAESQGRDMKIGAQVKVIMFENFGWEEKENPEVLCFCRL